MKAIATSVLITLLAAYASMAQPGRNGLGVRVCLDGIGITSKHFLDRSFAIETQLNSGGIVLVEGRSISAVGLILYHLTLPAPQFRIFFGGGAHIGTWTGREAAGHPNEFIAGLDGIGGVEYNFRRVPLGISGAFKPALNYVQEVEFFPHNMLGFSVRYYFGSNRVKPAVIPKLRKRRPPARH